MSAADLGYATFSVVAREREPLLRFMLDALRASHCRILNHTPPSVAPFRIAFELPSGGRMGIVAYAFLANSKVTKNRPNDEHRFQVKYGTKDGKEHELWQDSFGLYTTLFVGINPERGFFVGADPVLHSPTKFFISVEFKEKHVEQVLRHHWYAWEREHRSGDGGPIELLVAGTPDSFLRYVLFEREALGEDQGHRNLLADQSDQLVAPVTLESLQHAAVLKDGARAHELARELKLTESEVLDLIDGTPRLKMAVRGWAAEEHLVRCLRRVHGVTNAHRNETEGDADVIVEYGRGTRVRIQCKNVLRKCARGGIARLDFQRTRASIADRCSRYYSPNDFDVVAACMHAVSELWEFRYAIPKSLDRHATCAGKLSSNVRIDERWAADAASILRQAVA